MKTDRGPVARPADPPGEKGSAAGAAKGKGKTAEAWERPLEHRETHRALYGGFRILGELLRSSESVTAAEFDEVARDYLDVVERFPFLEPYLRVIIRVLGPLATLESLWSKLSRLMRSSKLKRPSFRRRPAAAADAMAEPALSESDFAPAAPDPDVAQAS